MVLYCDYDEVVTLDDMVYTIPEHLATDADYYKGFHAGDVLQDVEGYFKLGNYCDSIVYVIIIANAHALHLNLSIYHLKFTCDPGIARGYQWHEHF